MATNVRKRKTATNAIIFMAAAIGAVVLLNLISQKRFVRADLTETNEFTLSDASRNMVASLDKPIVVKAFFSKDLQPPFNTLERRVRDLLDEYRAYSNGMLTFEVKNPEDTEDDKEEAGGFGINPVSAEFLSETRVEMRAFYFGVAFVHQDKQEVIGDLRRVQNLEYDFSSAIKRVTSDAEKKVIGFASGHGELIDLEGAEKAFQQLFGGLYEVRSIKVDEGTPIGDDVNALLVINPSNIVSERGKYEIDQFIIRGGAAAFFLATHAQDQRFPIARAQPVITTLEPVLANYGIDIKREVVIDRRNNTQMLVPTPEGLTVVNNPLAIQTDDLNREHIITKDLGALGLPFSSPITIKDELKNQEGAQIEVLVRSMAESTSRGNLTDTTPEQLFEASPGETAGPFDLAVAVVGNFKSFFADKDVPSPTSQPAGGAAGPRETLKASPTAEPRSRLFVMANGEFLLRQRRLQRSAVVFLQNLVDWLVADEALISIRSRGRLRPLQPLEPGQKSVLTYANVLGLPLGFALFGLIRWTLRRKRKVDLWDGEGA